MYCYIYQNSFSEIATNPFAHGVGGCYTWILYISGHLLQFPNIIPTNNCLNEFGTNITCWRENSYHSWESHFSLTLCRERRSCVLEIIFRGKIFTDISGNSLQPESFPLMFLVNVGSIISNLWQIGSGPLTLEYSCYSIIMLSNRTINIQWG